MAEASHSLLTVSAMTLPRRRRWRVKVKTVCAATTASALHARIQKFIVVAPGIEEICARLVQNQVRLGYVRTRPFALKPLCHVALCCGKNYS